MDIKHLLPFATTHLPQKSAPGLPVADFVQQTQAFRKALDAGGELPPNPFPANLTRGQVTDLVSQLQDGALALQDSFQEKRFFGDGKSALSLETLSGAMRETAHDFESMAQGVLERASENRRWGLCVAGVAGLGAAVTLASPLLGLGLAGLGGVLTLVSGLTACGFLGTASDQRADANVLIRLNAADAHQAADLYDGWIRR